MDIRADLVEGGFEVIDVVFEHFNASASATALLLAAEPNLVAATGVDRACGFEQLEAAPEYKSGY